VSSQTVRECLSRQLMANSNQMRLHVVVAVRPPPLDLPIAPVKGSLTTSYKVHRARMRRLMSRRITYAPLLVARGSKQGNTLT